MNLQGRRGGTGYYGCGTQTAGRPSLHARTSGFARLAHALWATNPRQHERLWNVHRTSSGRPRGARWGFRASRAGPGPGSAQRGFGFGVHVHNFDFLLHLVPSQISWPGPGSAQRSHGPQIIKTGFQVQILLKFQGSRCVRVHPGSCKPRRDSVGSVGVQGQRSQVSRLRVWFHTWVELGKQLGAPASA